MNPTYMVFMTLLPVYILLFRSSRKKKQITAIRKADSKEYLKMTEIAKSFIGSECEIRTIDSSIGEVQKILEVSDDEILCENRRGVKTIFNARLVLFIREIPAKKKK